MYVNYIYELKITSLRELAVSPLRRRNSYIRFREIIVGCCENCRRDVSISTVWVKYRGMNVTPGGTFTLFSTGLYTVVALIRVQVNCMCGVTGIFATFVVWKCSGSCT